MYASMSIHRQWLPVSEAIVLLDLASLLEAGGIKSTSLQPYLSAINNYHEDLGLTGPAKGQTIPQLSLDHAQTTPKPSPNTPHTAGTGGPVPVKSVQADLYRKTRPVYTSGGLIPRGGHANQYRRACTSGIGTGPNRYRRACTEIGWYIPAAGSYRNIYMNIYTV